MFKFHLNAVLLRPSVHITHHKGVKFTLDVFKMGMMIISEAVLPVPVVL